MKYRVSGVWFLLPTLVVIGLSTFGLSTARAESVAEWITRGNRFYAEERYPEAIEAYRHALQLDPTSPVIQYNLGTALARSGSADEAIKALAQSTQSADEPLQKRDAWFNLGVADAESAAPPQSNAKGEAKVSSDPQQAIKKLTDSVQAFRQAILSDPDDMQAKHNYELTLDRLEKLKAQQQKQQQQNSDENKDQQKSDQNQDEQDQQQKGDKDQEKNEQNKDQQDQQQKNDQDQEKQDRQQKGDQNQDQKDQQQEDKGESQEKGLEKDQQQNPESGQDHKEPQASPQQEPPQSSGGTAGSAGQEPPLTPDQMNALRILNLLEKEKPEQFKELFRFKGAPSHQLEKDW